ncbi:MAG: hypothetical protein H6739_29450 [Alphaproteobacteria bacterium]|nr:hypothetical protein [Alphaproteobacteria bacterium]
MATSITGNLHNITQRVAMDSTAGNCEAVTLPTWAKKCTIAFKQSDGSTNDSGKLAFSGTDGAAIGTDFMPISSGGAYSFDVAGGGRDSSGLIIYIAADTNSAYAHIHVEG